MVCQLPNFKTQVLFGKGTLVQNTLNPYELGMPIEVRIITREAKEIFLMPSNVVQMGLCDYKGHQERVTKGDCKGDWYKQTF